MSQPTLMAPLPQARAWWLAVFLASSDPLEAENRRRLYRALNQFPGLHLAALAREADVDERLARYHIRVLVKSGLATERREGNLNLYYPKVEHELGSKEVVDQRVKDQLALLRRPVPLRIVLGLLDQEEGLSMGDVAEIADISRSTATYHVGNLEDEGLVHIRKEGRHRVVALTDAEATADLLASFPPPDDVVSGFIEMWDQLDL